MPVPESHYRRRSVLAIAVDTMAAVLVEDLRAGHRPGLDVYPTLLQLSRGRLVICSDSSAAMLVACDEALPILVQAQRDACHMSTLILWQL